jgi:peptidoglycan LD-endopeptidase LytH
MNRLGQAILALILLAAIGFAAMVTLGDGRAPVSAPAAPPVAAAKPGAPLAMPVAGVRRADLVDSWGQDRDGGDRRHEAIDIMAPGGTPVTAAAPGRVEKLFRSAAGGTTAYIRSSDGAWSFYYAHLAGYAPGLAEGQAVRAGDPIGYVGDTGNAGAGNTHLHFAVSRMRDGEGWWQGEPVNPYPLLAGNAPPR